MGVYVDDWKAPFGRMFMSHLGADTTEELLQFVDNIGVARKWIQYPGTWREHFDICLTKRAKALTLGAEPVTPKDFVRRQMKKKL
jgi:hypothetical protein